MSNEVVFDENEVYQRNKLEGLLTRYVFADHPTYMAGLGAGFRIHRSPDGKRSVAVTPQNGLRLLGTFFDPNPDVCPINDWTETLYKVKVL